MSLEVVPIRNNLLVDVNSSKIKLNIINRIRELNIEFTKYKLDAEMLTYVCNLIEYLVTKKDNIDKKQLVLDIYRDLLGPDFTDDVATLITNNIEFIHKNKNIKKVSYYKLFKTGLYEWIKKKF